MLIQICDPTTSHGDSSISGEIVAPNQQKEKLIRAVAMPPIPRFSASVGDGNNQNSVITQAIDD
jgi:hypothetical protein